MTSFLMNVPPEHARSKPARVRRQPETQFARLAVRCYSMFSILILTRLGIREH